MTRERGSQQNRPEPTCLLGMAHAERMKLPLHAVPPDLLAGYLRVLLGSVLQWLLVSNRSCWPSTSLSQEIAAKCPGCWHEAGVCSKVSSEVAKAYLSPESSRPGGLRVILNDCRDSL